MGLAKHIHQSALRYPLTAILGSGANVITLRELMRHGGELSAPSLVKRSGLAKASVRQALLVLTTMTLVDAIGSGCTRLFRVQRDHPLAAPLDALFREEEQRFEAILASVRLAAEHCQGLVAAWIYGSVARGLDRETSDVDVAVVGEPQETPRIEQAMRETLREAEGKLAFTASVVAIDTNDVLRLDATRDRWWTDVAQDNLPIAGDPPDVLAGRLRRQQRTPRRKAS
jgi:predicted nucleotidyltransferase